MYKGNELSRGEGNKSTEPHNRTISITEQIYNSQAAKLDFGQPVKTSKLQQMPRNYGN